VNFNTFLIGLLICFLLSFLVGLERQIRRRYIGLRTMILVAIGSYMFVSFSFLVTGYQIDVSRVAAQVVAGIGFLGAGVIIKDNESSKVRGLTTAATLWCDAGIGILCAAGFIKEAVIASLVVLFANVILRYVNGLINSKVENMNINEIFRLTIYLNNSDDSIKLVEYMISYVSKNDEVEIVNYLVDDNKVKFEFMVKKTEDKKFDKFVNNLVMNFRIKKYEYKKINEIKIEDENDEL